jgi:hypothetical protein
MPTIRPAVKLVGIDGNAFAIIGACIKAARRAKMPAEDIKMIQNEMTSGSYDHLLATALKYFAVEGEEDEEDGDEEECFECGGLGCEGECAGEDDEEES